MIQRKRMVLFGLLVLVWAGICASCTVKPVLGLATTIPSLSKDGRGIQHVLIVVLDGLRAQEAWLDPAKKNTPHLAGELAAKGTLFTRVENQGPTYTNAGHTALVTGFYQDINNQGLELPSHPTLFQLYRAAAEADADQAWVVTSKDKLGILADSKAPGWKGLYVAKRDVGKQGGGLGSGYRDDAQTLQAMKKILAQAHPKLCLLNFKNPDESAHTGDFAKYLKAIQSVDALAADLWNWIQADPVMSGKTLVLFTSDHGRHCDGNGAGFADHGDGCACCRRVWLLAMGPGMAAGRVIESPVQTLDIPATAARALGFSVPGSVGKDLSLISQ
jgi:hypothetical protein